MEHPKMNVGELVDLLEGVDRGLEVWVEGCDCVDDAHGLDVEGDHILIARDDGWGVPDNRLYPPERKD